MKFLIVRTLMLLTLIVGSLVGVAAAQTNQIAKFNIPFAFVVGNQNVVGRGIFRRPYGHTCSRAARRARAVRACKHESIRP